MANPSVIDELFQQEGGSAITAAATIITLSPQVLQMTMTSAISANRAAIALLFLMAASLSHAFTNPSQQVQHRSSTSLKSIPEINPFLLSDGLTAATRMGGGSGFNGDTAGIEGSLSALRSFFIVISAGIFGLTAVAYLTAAFLVPKAAEQLETDTKRLRPGLWEEYELKLELGETMVNRPDLLQELGNVMQPIIAQDYEMKAAEKFGDNKTDDTTKEN